MFPRLQQGSRFNFGGMLPGATPVTAPVARPVTGTVARPAMGPGPMPVTGPVARPMPVMGNPATFNPGQFLQGGAPIAGPYMPFGPQRRPVTGGPMAPPRGMRSF